MKAKPALALIGLLLLSVPLFAQAPPVYPEQGRAARPAQPAQPATAMPRQPQPGTPGHDPIGDAVFPPELIMRNQQAIGLSAEQKTFIRDQIRQAQLRFTELQWQLEDAGESLRALLDQNQVNESQALGALERVLDAERQIKTAQITLMIRIKNKLTPEQQARLRELRGAVASTPPPPSY